MFATCPLGGRFLCRFLHPERMHRSEPLWPWLFLFFLFFLFFPSIHQFKQAIQTFSNDSKI
jgi:hypothetical protein